MPLDQIHHPGVVVAHPKCFSGRQNMHVQPVLLETSMPTPAHRVFAQLAAAPWAGRHRITVDQDETTCLQVKFAAIKTLPPVGKQKRYRRF
ncbi:hypothetical protein NKH85_31760 [Mesorhizobium sp. M0924]|uniref:hypothetical protein n=1 Tax=unclassified Mesorhizobium TaxID=325217 RepID=UPI00333DD9CB